MNGIRLPEDLSRRARAILSGEIAPVPARDAATVVILRPSRDGRGPEVYLLRRKASMAFAAGAYVFPGGSVDPRDTDQAIAWAGPAPETWARVFGADVETARGLVCAAVRETFEESGVLLAGPSADTVVADTTGADWEADREALIARSLSFAEFLNKRNLVLRTDLLKAWAHWITPEVEHKRFDTRFFVAALPPGQRTRDVGGEADQVAWLRPEQALDRAGRKQIFLMPPTFRTLTEVSEYPDIGAVLAGDREIVTTQPRAAEIDGEMWLVIPGEDHRVP